MQPGQRHEERGPLCRRGAANGLQRRRPRCISFRQRYSNDGPGFFNLTLTTATDVVFRNRFQERVKMTFDGSSPRRDRDTSVPTHSSGTISEA